MQVAANIVVSASLNLLLALSVQPSYNTTRFFNLSHAFLPTAAAYTSWLITTKLSVPLSIAGLVGACAALGMAVLFELFLFGPLRSRGVAAWQLLVASIGVYTILVNVVSVLFGDETLTAGMIYASHRILGASISDVRLMIILVGLLGFILMAILLRLTALGRAIRAVGVNPVLAEVFGISSTRTSVWAVALGGFYAGMAGVLAGFDTDLTPGMGFRLFISGIVSMILAGVGGVNGLVAGALLLAAGNHLVAYYVDSKWMDAVTFLILIGFLIWKPLGFSGRRLKKVEV